MSETPEKVVLAKINPDNYTFKINDNGRRMKIYIKFNQEESIGLKNFVRATKPEDVPENDFYKALFFKGIEGLQMDVMNQIRNSNEGQQIQAELDEIENTPSVEVITDDSGEEKVEVPE